MDKKDFKMLMYALYGNKQLIIPDGQTLQQWIDNAFIEKQEQLTLTDVVRQSEQLCQHKYQDIRYGTSRCVICGEEEQSF
jgi:hypothetical protein